MSWESHTYDNGLPNMSIPMIANRSYSNTCVFFFFFYFSVFIEHILIKLYFPNKRLIAIIRVPEITKRKGKAGWGEELVGILSLLCCKFEARDPKHTHTHTHIYSHTYMHIHTHGHRKSWGIEGDSTRE